MTARPPFFIETERLVIRLAEPDDAHEIIDYDRRNAEHFARWEPAIPAGWAEPKQRRESIARRRAEADAGTGYSFVALFRGESRIVARINLNNIVRSVFQACHLGYSVDKEHEGKGLASEAVGAIVAFAFETLNLHRVMANYQPSNERSGKLLRRLGFVPEGYARDYLYINGAWQDHILTSLVNTSLSSPPSR